MIAKDLHLRRKKDRVEVITLAAEKENVLPGKRHADWNANLRAFVPVRYVKSGRKGYLKGDALEADFVVVGRADPSTRWAKRPAATDTSAAALEDMRERDILELRKWILKHALTPSCTTADRKPIETLNPTPNSISALDQALHMILSGT